MENDIWLSSVELASISHSRAKSRNRKLRTGKELKDASPFSEQSVKNHKYSLQTLFRIFLALKVQGRTIDLLLYFLPLK